MKHGDLVVKDHLFGQIYEFANSLGEPHVNWWGIGYEYIPPDEFLEQVHPDQIPNHLRHFVTGGVYIGEEFFSESDIINLIAIVQQIQLQEEEFSFAEADLDEIYQKYSRLDLPSDKEIFIINYAHHIASVHPELLYTRCIDMAIENLRYLETR